MAAIAIVFLTVRPSFELFRFARTLASATYSVYVCVDDNSYTLPEYNSEKIQVLRFEKGPPERNGFKNTVARIKCASSRCKALYFFSKLNTLYPYVWMLEEDVFLPSIHTLPNIDSKYPDQDLLSPIHWLNPTGDVSKWQWKRAVGYVDPPWAASMVCGVRVSRRLLDCIAMYAKQHKTLFFDEVMFNTLALQNDLKVGTPDEMRGIQAKHDWKIEELNLFGLYHPVKNLYTQMYFRRMLLTPDTSVPIFSNSLHDLLNSEPSVENASTEEDAENVQEQESSEVVRNDEPCAEEGGADPTLCLATEAV